jgi:hypothetical protein
VRAGDGNQSVPPPTCEEAIVNPVSGVAECVNPPGAPVDPPPKRPPPTKEECLKHKDLDLAVCRQFDSGNLDAPPPAKH